MSEKLKLANRLEQKGHHITEYWDEYGKLRVYVDGKYMNVFRMRWFISWKGRRK